MNELVFVGLGLYDEKDITLRGLEELKEADIIFAEFYTSLMPSFSLKRLEKIIAKKIVIVSRFMLEDEDGKQLLESAKNGKVVFLVQGDPMIATTHINLRIIAEKKGIKTRLIHNASVSSAVRSVSGLQNYKYGKSVTVPFFDNGFVSETPYNVILNNKKMGLHTMCLLDIKAEENRYLTINNALEILLDLEAKKKKQIVTPKTFVVGVARAGSPYSIVKTDYIEKIIHYDFGAPPHTLIFLGNLHFMEAEALIILADAPNEIKEIIE